MIGVLAVVIVWGPATSGLAAGRAQRAEPFTLPAWRLHQLERAVPAPNAGGPAAGEPLDSICEQLGTSYVPDGPCEAWISRYAEHPNASADGILVAPDGARVFVTGSAEGPGGFPNLDFLTVAYDAATGAILWSRTYAGPGLYDATVPLQPIALSPDAATVYVTGGSFTGDARNGEWATLAYDATTGAERWRSVWNSPGSGLDFAYHVVPSADGTTVYVAGDSGEPEGGFEANATVVALDAATGEERWEATYDDPVGENDFADGLALAPDGRRVYLTSGSFEACDECPGRIDMQAVTVAYGTGGLEQGEALWREVHRGGFNNPDRPRDTLLTPDGGTLVVSTIASIPGKQLDFGTLALDTATGARRWYTTWGSPETELPNDLALAPDGRTAYVVGEGPRVGQLGLSHDDFATVAYDVDTGAERWVARDSFDTQWWNNQPDRAQAVAVSRDGTKVLVTGSSVGGVNHDDYWTIAYDAASGARLWTVRFDDQHDVDRPGAIAVDGSRVYVAGGGTVVDSGHPDTWVSELVTVAYPLVRPTFP